MPQASQKRSSKKTSNPLDKLKSLHEARMKRKAIAAVQFLEKVKKEINKISEMAMLGLKEGAAIEEEEP